MIGRQAFGGGTRRVCRGGRSRVPRFPPTADRIGPRASACPLAARAFAAGGRCGAASRARPSSSTRAYRSPNTSSHFGSASRNTTRMPTCFKWGSSSDHSGRSRRWRTRGRWAHGLNGRRMASASNRARSLTPGGSSTVYWASTLSWAWLRTKPTHTRS